MQPGPPEPRLLRARPVPGAAAGGAPGRPGTPRCPASSRGPRCPCPESARCRRPSPPRSRGRRATSGAEAALPATRRAGGERKRKREIEDCLEGAGAGRQLRGRCRGGAQGAAAGGAGVSEGAGAGAGCGAGAAGDCLHTFEGTVAAGGGAPAPRAEPRRPGPPFPRRSRALLFAESSAAAGGAVRPCLPASPRRATTVLIGTVWPSGTRISRRCRRPGRGSRRRPCRWRSRRGARRA